MMVDVFQRVCIDAVLWDSQMEWRMDESSMAQSLSTLAGMPSGPGALPGLDLPSNCRTFTKRGGLSVPPHRQHSGYGCQIMYRNCSECLQWTVTIAIAGMASLY